jgi:hypothetical protein
MKNTVFDELTLFWLLAVQASGAAMGQTNPLQEA